MTPPELCERPVRKLHQLLMERVFAVPKLQREFVWNGPKAAALLDSMYRGMPVGSIMVWETKKSHYDLLRQTLHILPTFDPANAYGWFLIDGQQRLSVIHESFAGGIKTNSSRQSIDFGRLCFVVNSDADDDDPSFFTYRRPVPREFIPVQDILATNWKRRFKTVPKWLRDRLQRCRERLLNYRVPVVVVRSDHLEEVREIFIRINSQGMKISAADRAFARASTVDLRDLAHALRAGLHSEFHGLNFNTVLQGFAFVTRERELDVGQRALEATINWWERQIGRDGQSSYFYKLWHRYRTAFGKAVDYLRENFSVYNTDFLPSENMLAALSVFFFHHPAAPNTRQRQEIRKWFWATGVGNRYSGRGYRRNLTGDVRFFTRLATGKGARFAFPDLVDRAEIARTEYTQRSALTNAYLCLLAELEPCYVANGQPVPCTIYASRANRSDRHHIFPRQLLANSGFSHREYNSLSNICFIVAEENQRFGMKRPDRYLEEFARRRHFARAMKSHLIPHRNGSGLWTVGVKKAFVQFRRQRLDLICRAFEREAGMRLFRKGQ